MKLSSITLAERSTFVLRHATIFYGHNGAGKDAVAQQLARSLSERLRQGGAASAQSPLFEYLHCISYANLSAFSGWESPTFVETLRHALEAVDERCAAAAQQCKSLATRNFDTHQRRIGVAQAELAQLDQAYASVWKHRQLLAYDDAQLREADQALISLENQQAQVSAQIAELAQRLHEGRRAQAASLLRQRAQARLSELEAFERDCLALEQLAHLPADESEHLRVLDERVARHRHEIDLMEVRRQASAQRLARASAKLDQIRRHEAVAKNLAVRAALHQARIEAFVANPPVTKSRQFRRGVLVAAGLLFAVGVLALLMPKPLQTPLTVASVVAGFACLFLGRRTHIEPDIAAFEVLLTQIKKQWNSEPLAPPLECMQVAGAADYFATIVRNHQKLVEEAREQAAYTCRVEEEMTEAMQRATALLEHTLQPRLNERDAWLLARGFSDSEAYYAAHSARTRLQTQESDVLKKRPTWRDRTQRQALRVLLMRRLAVLPQSEHPPSLQSLHAWAHQLQEAAFTQHYLRERHAQVLADKNARLCAVRDGLRGLPDELTQLAARRHAAREALVVNNPTSALQGAADLLEVMATHPDAPLRILRHMVDYFLDAAHLPASRALSGLDPQSLLYGEATCAAAAPTLKTGLRELVLLGLRLAHASLLASKDASLLILNEPFLMLDEDNEEAAISMVEAFVTATQWQVVWLTKERRLRERILQRFADAQLITLS